MPSVRLFHCQRCHQQVMVCQRCDRGQRYCAGPCRQLAKKAANQRAQTKYQKSRQGRINNALRQRRFRQRQKENAKKVTHPGSPPGTAGDLLVEKPCRMKNVPIPVPLGTDYCCHFCRERCGTLFRVGFLKKRTTTPYQPDSRMREKRHDHQ